MWMMKLALLLHAEACSGENVFCVVVSTADLTFAQWTLIDLKNDINIKKWQV